MGYSLPLSKNSNRWRQLVRRHRRLYQYVLITGRRTIPYAPFLQYIPRFVGQNSSVFLHLNANLRVRAVVIYSPSQGKCVAPGRILSTLGTANVYPVLRQHLSQDFSTLNNWITVLRATCLSKLVVPSTGILKWNLGMAPQTRHKLSLCIEAPCISFRILTCPYLIIYAWLQTYLPILPYEIKLLVHDHPSR